MVLVVSVVRYDYICICVHLFSPNRWALVSSDSVASHLFRWEIPNISICNSFRCGHSVSQEKGSPGSRWLCTPDRQCPGSWVEMEGWGPHLSGCRLSPNPPSLTSVPPFFPEPAGRISSEKKPLVFWLEEGQSPGCMGQGRSSFWIQSYFGFCSCLPWFSGILGADELASAGTYDHLPPLGYVGYHSPSLLFVSSCDCRHLLWWWLTSLRKYVTFSVSWTTPLNLKIWRSERCLSKKNCTPVLHLMKYHPHYHHLFTRPCLTHARVELRLGDSCILKWVNSWLVSWSLSKILDVQLLPSKERIPLLAGRACLFFLVKKSSGAARGVHPKGLTASRGGSNLSLWAPLSPRFVSTLVPGSRQRKPALINTLQLSTCQHVFWSYL